MRIMKVIRTYDYLICEPLVARNLFCKCTLVIPVHALETYVTHARVNLYDISTYK